MSAFICAGCDNFRDADDGCKEAPDGFRLICSDCMDDEPDELPPRGEFSAAQQAIIDAHMAEVDSDDEGAPIK